MKRTKGTLTGLEKWFGFRILDSIVMSSIFKNKQRCQDPLRFSSLRLREWNVLTLKMQKSERTSMNNIFMTTTALLFLMKEEEKKL